MAKVHFPEFPEKLLALICARAMQSESYLKGMEFAARYASALAQDRCHRKPTTQDVDEAINRMMPSRNLPAAVEPASSDQVQPSSKRNSKPLKTGLTRPSGPVNDGDEAGRREGETTTRRPGAGADLDRAKPLRVAPVLVPA